MKKLKIDKKLIREVIEWNVKSHKFIDMDGFAIYLEWNNELNGILLKCSFDTTGVKKRYDSELDGINNVVTQTRFIDIMNEEEINENNFQSYLYEVIYQSIQSAEREIGYSSNILNSLREIQKKLNECKSDNKESKNSIINWASVINYIEYTYVFKALDKCYKILDLFSIDEN